MAISEFKAKCLATLERVRRTRRSVLVTKRGVPIAEVSPPPVAELRGQSAFGCMAGSAREIGDVLEPLPEGDWQALR